MKRTIRIAPLILAAALTAGAFAEDDVTNSPHNLNNFGLVITTPRGANQVCLPCHIPHNAYYDAGTIQEVLWNHAETDQVFDMYVTRTQSPIGQPEGSSKMCLSCHDGVTAVDSYGGRWPGAGTTVITDPDSVRDTDLTDDHPISIIYPSDRTQYRDPASFGTDSVKLVTIDGIADRVECVSCHNPHDLSPWGAFLREELNESRICLKCHIK